MNDKPWYDVTLVSNNILGVRKNINKSSKLEGKMVINLLIMCDSTKAKPKEEMVVVLILKVVLYEFSIYT